MRLRLLAVLALLVPGLAVTVGTGVAHAAPGHTISTATTPGIGVTVTGGGGAVDFWKVPLSGGEQVNFTVNGSATNSYFLDMYAPATTDATFPEATAFTSGSTNYQAKSTITLQAPYTGTFILAVCENVTPCSVANPKGVMSQYLLAENVANGGISPVTAADETKGAATISGALAMPVGYFEAGGANAVDFWKVPLSGGEQVNFTINGSATNSFIFDLYAQGTNVASFPRATAFTSGWTDYQVKSTITMQAPYTGTFILAVCENVIPCSWASKTAVMNPYTFTTSIADGGISAVTAAEETKAGATISAAPEMPSGYFEAGGANAVDFWKVNLYKGREFLFVVNGSATNAFVFDLYPPTTTDANFSKAVAVSSAWTNYQAKSTFSLVAPSTGNYVLAVCEDVIPCSWASKTAVMNPYTFTTGLMVP
jgi:hypothetical protein